MTADTPAQLRAITDPTTRARAIQTAQAQQRRTAAELADLLRDTVAELRAGGASLADVAKILGVSRAWAQKLAEPT